MKRLIRIQKAAKTVNKTDDDNAAKELKNVRLDNVSFVDRGANGKKFAVMKRDGAGNDQPDQAEAFSFWQRLTKMFFGDRADVKVDGDGNGTSGSDRAKQLEAVVKLREHVDRAGEAFAETGRKGALEDLTKSLVELESGLSDSKLVRKSTQTKGVTNMNAEERIAKLEKELADLKKDAGLTEDDVDQDEVLARFGYEAYESYDENTLLQTVNEDITALEAEYTKRSPAEVTKSLEAEDDLTDVDKAYGYEAYVRYMPFGKKPMAKKSFSDYLAAMSEKGYKPRKDKAGRPKYSAEGRPAMRRAAGKAKVKPDDEDKDTSKSANATDDSIAEAVTKALGPTLNALQKRIDAIEVATKTVAQATGATTEKVQVIETRLTKTRQQPRGNAGGVVRVEKSQVGEDGRIVDPQHPDFWTGILTEDPAPVADV